MGIRHGDKVLVVFGLSGDRAVMRLGEALGFTDSRGNLKVKLGNCTATVEPGQWLAIPPGYVVENGADGSDLGNLSFGKPGRQDGKQD